MVEVFRVENPDQRFQRRYQDALEGILSGLRNDEKAVAQKTVGNFVGLIVDEDVRKNVMSDLVFRVLLNVQSVDDVGQRVTGYLSVLDQKGVELRVVDASPGQQTRSIMK